MKDTKILIINRLEGLKNLSVTHLFFKVRSTVIFVANAIKNHFEVRSTVTFATKITVLRTLKKRWVKKAFPERLFFKVFFFQIKY
jgi:hypothetical protein